jgi:hypothetical protein
LFAAPVFASGNGHNNNNDKVCVRHENNGKDYRWVKDVEDLHIGDKVVKDKFCKDNGNGNGDHNGNGNGNGDHNGNGNGNGNGDHNGNGNGASTSSSTSSSSSSSS